ncbi:Crp/Fnr family transcriptional regulator [Alloalcanivorax mobilis]|uniref:Crp/Fnr family transcriptional regulator n=1 Tax=Alloalcanivorax mobilis TaxID=2019569 RepID=UPI0012FFFA9B|nr:cyclic nucleotide-binding domain-containing protein [Alloalcanivorax mobilis]|tara:strand:+ start:195 stop:983 length:789 start_codon:yes stop_codon:yes gene_type:complete
MMTLSDALPGFTALARDYKKLGSELSAPVSALASARACAAGERLTPNPDCLYLVRGGTLVAHHGERRLFACDEGDWLPLMPEVGYHAEGAVLLAEYPRPAVQQRWRDDPRLACRWERLENLRSRLLVCMLAARVGSEHHTDSTFVYARPGDDLIRQGERADDVYHLFEGQAQVLVNGVAVGQVGEGELLGAIAVLTGAPRNATVRALTPCSALRVPGQQFHQLISSHPSLIERLLGDMARQITGLNDRLVALSEPAQGNGAG